MTTESDVIVLVPMLVVGVLSELSYLEGHSVKNSIDQEFDSVMIKHMI